MREHFDEGDNNSFSLVVKGLALFNGYIGTNGLMNIQLEPVSTSLSASFASSANDSSPELLHRRLGHVGKSYLRLMCKHKSVEENLEETEITTSCDICSMTKAIQLPYNHTRPRASCFLENVHVDLSGIIRTRGLNNEMYYAMFCDDYSSYRHIFALKSKEKTEVCLQCFHELHCSCRTSDVSETQDLHP